MATARACFIRFAVSSILEEDAVEARLFQNTGSPFIAFPGFPLPSVSVAQFITVARLVFCLSGRLSVRRAVSYGQRCSSLLSSGRRAFCSVIIVLSQRACRGRARSDDCHLPDRFVSSG